jgi:hypothetical protein
MDFGIQNQSEDTAMKTSIHGKAGSAGLMGLVGLLAAMLMIGACALRETSPDDEDAGVVISVKDSSKVQLVFDNDNDTTFTDSGLFDLVALREKMDEKGIKPESIEITGLVVSYDDSAKNFIANNEGVAFYLRIYVRENDTGEAKLALETLVDDDVQKGFKALAFDPDLTFLQLGQHIFGNAAGFPSILNSIKDESKLKIRVIATLTLKDKLKVKGTLNLNMVVTVAGKI